MNTNNPIRITFAAVALMAALTTGVRAADVPQVHVKFADLNINTPAGAAALYHRIRVAADQVCALPVTGDLAFRAKTQACTDRAVANAVATVNNPTLTGLYDLNTGKAQASRFAEVR
jgi:UrcA family protein